LDIAADMRSATHIARLDDDDQWLPAHLRILAEAYQSHPEAGFAHTQAQGELPHPYWFPAYPEGAAAVSQNLHNLAVLHMLVHHGVCKKQLVHYAIDSNMSNCRHSE
jgi:hypothetical protein